MLQLGTGALPHITLSQSFITPRQTIFNDTALDQWIFGSSGDVYHAQTDLRFQQNFGRHIKLATHLAYGSPNYRFTEDFRVHTLYGQIDYPGYSLKIGRLTQWNSLVNARFDGFDYSVKSTRFGELNIAAGKVPSFTGSNEDETFFITSWGSKSPNLKVTVHLWGNYVGNEESIKTGFIMTKKLFHQINLKTYISWNISENEPYYNRIRLSRKYKHHRILLDLTHRNFDLKKIYPFISKSLFVSPTATFSVQSYFLGGYQLLNKFGYRFSRDTRFYYSGSFSTHSVQFTVTAGNNSDDLFIGGSFSFSANLFNTISYGGSLSINSVDFAENIESQDSIGAYTWVKWRPVRNLMIEIFARAYQNGYFNQDGRGGLNVVYTF